MIQVCVPLMNGGAYAYALVHNYLLLCAYSTYAKSGRSMKGTPIIKNERPTTSLLIVLRDNDHLIMHNHPELHFNAL